MILFVHASPVSLAATQSALERLRVAAGARHALIPGLVDPSAMRFMLSENDLVRLMAAVAPHVRGDESRIVLSCSVYNGFAPELEKRLGLAVERSDDAGARSALARGSTIALVVTYPPSYAVIESHLQQIATDQHMPVDIRPLLSENAFAFAGDAERYARTIGDAVERVDDDVNVVFLSQFSMDPYAPAIAERTGLPVVSALESCVRRLFEKSRN